MFNWLLQRVLAGVLCGKDGATVLEETLIKHYEGAITATVCLHWSGDI